MKDIVISGAQLEQILKFLDEQPHKFAAPLIQFFGQLHAAQHPPEQPSAEVEAEEPAAERE